MNRQALDELKQQIPLLDYLEAHHWRPVRRLSRSRWMGLCPLHNDHKPSLNARGLRTGYNRSFNVQCIHDAVRTHGIKTRRERLRESGLLTSLEMAAMLHTSPAMIWCWGCRGRLRSEPCTTRRYLYYPPSPDLVKEFLTRESHREVQYVT